MHDFGDYGGVGVQRPLLRAGGVAVVLPQLPGAIEDTLEHLDAVVLAPGRDIAPERYGQPPDELLAPTEPQRDRSSSYSCRPRSGAGCPYSACAGGCRC